MAEATNHAAHPEGDEDLKRGVIENLDALDRDRREAGQYRKLFES